MAPPTVRAPPAQAPGSVWGCRREAMGRGQHPRLPMAIRCRHAHRGFRVHQKAAVVRSASAIRLADGSHASSRFLEYGMGVSSAETTTGGACRASKCAWVTAETRVAPQLPAWQVSCTTTTRWLIPRGYPRRGIASQSQCPCIRFRYRFQRLWPPASATSMPSAAKWIRRR